MYLLTFAQQSFVRHLEVFDGAEGHSLPGFPFTLPASTSHSTPLIHDILNDGNPHIGIVTCVILLADSSCFSMPLICFPGMTPSLFGSRPRACPSSATASEYRHFACLRSGTTVSRTHRLMLSCTPLALSAGNACGVPATVPFSRHSPHVLLHLSQPTNRFRHRLRSTPRTVSQAACCSKEFVKPAPGPPGGVVDKSRSASRAACAWRA